MLCITRQASACGPPITVEKISEAPPIENRRPQIHKLLGSRRHLTLAPDLLIKLHEALQDFRLVGQHLEEIDYLATFLFEFLVKGNGRPADLLLFTKV